MKRVIAHRALDLVFSSVLVGCLPHVSQDKTTILVEPLSSLPQSLPPNPLGLSTEKKHPYLIPPGILWMSSVTRPTAYLREGPGGQYPIADQVLSRGTQTILLERHGVWCKIYIPKKDLVGWSHQDSLGGFFKNQTSVLIKPEFFPTITTTDSTLKIYPYPRGPMRMVGVTRGSVLRKIAFEKNKNLVLITTQRSAPIPEKSLSHPPLLEDPHSPVSPLFLGQILWVDAHDAW